MTGRDPVRRPGAAVAIALAALLAGAVVANVSPGDLHDPLWIALIAGAIVSRFALSDLSENVLISGMFLCGALAAGLLGPAAAQPAPLRRT